MSSTGYRAVLRTPGVPRAFLFSALGRLSYSIVGLGLLLTTEHATGSFAAAGLALGVFGAVTVAAPFKSRLVDRLGRRRTLPVLAVLYALALLVAGLSTSRTAGVYVVAGALAGLTAPPLGATMRGVWAALFSEPAARQRAYGLDATSEEVLYAVGPLIVGALVLWADAGDGLILSAVLAVAGTLGLATSPALRASEQERTKVGSHRDHARLPNARPDDGRRSGVLWRRLVGPLHRRGFAVLVLICFGFGLGAGPLDVAVAARADQVGQPAAAGYLLAAVAVGSAFGGLLWGRGDRVRRTSRTLAALLGGIAVAAAVAGLTSSLPVLAVVLVLLGGGLAPLFIVAWLATDTLVPEEERTEANTWLDTANNLGVSAGAAVAGLMADRSDPGLALLAGAGVLAITALAARLSSRALDHDQPWSPKE